MPLDTNAKLQKLLSAISHHGCPACRGCGRSKTKTGFEDCDKCGGTGEGRDWAAYMTRGKNDD